MPTKYYKDTLQSSIDSSIYQELQFYQDDTKLVPASVNAQTYGRNLKLVYTFKNSAVTAEVTFSLVEATNGKFRGRTAFPVRLDQYMSELYEIQDTHGKTWIVTANAVFKTNGSINAHFYMNLINHRLPVYGHEDISNPKRLVASQASWSSGTRSVQLLDISAGISKKYASDISEAGIVSYEEANPFVILGDIYDHLSGSYEDPLTGETRWGILSGVEGQSTISNGAEYFAYTPPLANGNPDETADILTMWSNTTSGYVDGFDRLEGYSTQSWGFRNLYAEGEQVVPFSDDGTKIESDFGSMDTNAAMLAIIPDSTSATGYTVKELKASAVPRTRMQQKPRRTRLRLRLDRTRM